MDKKEKWEQIIELQQQVKSMLLLAEEHNEGNHETYIQPMKEQRDALEHIVRSQAAEYGFISENEEYINHNYDKAIGHLYRAFFDAADFMGILLREKVIDAMNDYDHDCIANVMPEYYQVIRPELEQINTELSKYRADKDVAKSATVELIKKYKQKIDQLIKYSIEITKRIPSLNEYSKSVAKAKQKEEEAETKKTTKQNITTVIINIVVAIFSFLLGYFFKGDN